MSFKTTVRQSLTLAWPIMLANTLHVLSDFFAIALLSRLSHNSLAASALISITNISINVSLVTILFAISPIVARHHNNNNPTNVGNIFQMGMIVALLLSLVAILFFSHIDQILVWLRQPPIIAQLTQDYYNAYVWGLPACFLLTTIDQVIVGVQKPRFSIFIGASWLMCTLVFAYGLAFGQFGFPKLGVYGIGMGISISAWTTTITALLLLRVLPFYHQFQFFTWHGNFKVIKDIIGMGIHIGGQLSMELLAMGFAGIMVGWLGSNVLAGYQIANQVGLIISIPLFALSQVASIQIGHVIGSKKHSKVHLIVPANLGLGSIYFIMSAIVILMFPHLVINLFLPDSQAYSQTANYARWLIYLGLLLQLADGIRNIITGALRGLYDTKYAMKIGIICVWFIAIPLGYILAFPLHIGVYGISIGFII